MLEIINGKFLHRLSKNKFYIFTHVCECVLWIKLNDKKNLNFMTADKFSFFTIYRFFIFHIPLSLIHAWILKEKLISVILINIHGVAKFTFSSREYFSHHFHSFSIYLFLWWAADGFLQQKRLAWVLCKQSRSFLSDGAMKGIFSI